MIQKKPSPEKGIIRYSTRVSLFTGEGSKIHSGFQEAGLLILGETTDTIDFNSTFVGIAFEPESLGNSGVGEISRRQRHKRIPNQLEIPDTLLPFHVTEGEHEIIAEHDVRNNTLGRIQINGVDITGHVPLPDRLQRIHRGLFGIRGFMDPLGSGVSLQQFYWYYRVEDISG